MITVQQATKNIYNIAKEASPEVCAQGKQWYSEAHSFCLALAHEFNTPLEVVVGVLAVLSPQCAWETNKLATRDMLETKHTTRQVYPFNVNKARRILDGETFEQVTASRRYGKKVKAFYDNILFPETSIAVTVDTHAIRAAFDATDLTARHIRWVFECGGNKILQLAYQKAATKFKLQPLKLQAIVWLQVKQSLEGGVL